MQNTSKTIAAAALILDIAIGLPPTASAGTITEDSPSWDCRTMGNRICGPTNAQQVVAGCYSDLDASKPVALWPCHVVVDPATGEGDVYEGLAR